MRIIRLNLSTFFSRMTIRGHISYINRGFIIELYNGRYFLVSPLILGLREMKTRIYSRWRPLVDPALLIINEGVLPRYLELFTFRNVWFAILMFSSGCLFRIVTIYFLRLKYITRIHNKEKVNALFVLPESENLKMSMYAKLSGRTDSFGLTNGYSQLFENRPLFQNRLVGSIISPLQVIRIFCSLTSLNFVAMWAL